MAHLNVADAAPTPSTGVDQRTRRAPSARREERVMSVIMTMTVAGNAGAMEQWAKQNPAKMQSILDSAKRHGLIAHRFYGTQDGSNVLVLDEWPDKESFEAFFQEQESEIRPMFDAVQPSGEPAPMYWEELSTGDVYGWGA
jgi:hypothetical protein